jgi:GNAT superfamily N-acetyltransferase
VAITPTSYTTPRDTILSAGSIERAAAPGKLRRNAPDAIPVSIIRRLAVRREHAGKVLGADLLAEALHRIAVAAQRIGIAAQIILSNKFCH